MRPTISLAVLAVSVCILFGISFSQSVGTAPYASPSIMVENLSIPATISSNSPLVVDVGLGNMGSLATGNITLNVDINGPMVSNHTYVVGALSPLQNESLTISRTGMSVVPGSYDVLVYATYTFDGEPRQSNVANAGYMVVPLLPQQNENSSVVLSAKGINITYMPTYTSLFQGSEYVSQLGIRNTANSKELVRIGVDRNYTSLLQLSTNSLYILPNSTAFLQLLLKSNSPPIQLSTYVIPIRLSVNMANGSTENTTEHIVVMVSNRSNETPRILDQLILNSTKSTIGIVEINSGINSTIRNATLTTFLPSYIANSSSQITTYGLQSNVSDVNGGYRINWTVPYLPNGQTVYAYYSINSTEGAQFPPHMQNILDIPSTLKPTNLLKIVNLSLPTLYVNTTTKISSQILYTGTKAQTVYTYLTGPPGITVYNASQYSNATPNLLITKSFYIMTVQGCD